MEEKLNGQIEHIIFRNEENGYTVFSLMADGAEVTCVGVFSAISEGESIEVSGSWSVLSRKNRNVLRKSKGSVNEKPGRLQFR